MTPARGVTPARGLTPNYRRKKTGRVSRFFRSQGLLRSLDVARLLFAAFTRSDLEGDFLSFGERLEAVHVDRGEVREEVFAAAVRGDEAKAFGVVKPLNGTGCHVCRSCRYLKKGQAQTTFN